MEFRSQRFWKSRLKNRSEIRHSRLISQMRFLFLTIAYDGDSAPYAPSITTVFSSSFLPVETLSSSEDQIPLFVSICILLMVLVLFLWEPDV